VFAGPKVPEVFLSFWVVKLLTTGIGETASDFMGTASLVVAGVVGVGGFVVALRMQLRAEGYRPITYWVTVLMVAVFGTMIADGPHVALGTPYYVDSALYLVLLVALLGWWKRTEGTLSVHSITTARRERFYWGTVLLTFGLGTALGDTTAAGWVWGSPAGSRGRWAVTSSSPTTPVPPALLVPGSKMRSRTSTGTPPPSSRTAISVRKRTGAT
jgi:uncharacterized membrane-anchored protein